MSCSAHWWRTQPIYGHSHVLTLSDPSDWLMNDGRWCRNEGFAARDSSPCALRVHIMWSSLSGLIESSLKRKTGQIQRRWLRPALTFRVEMSGRAHASSVGSTKQIKVLLPPAPTRRLMTAGAGQWTAMTGKLSEARTLGFAVSSCIMSARRDFPQSNSCAAKCYSVVCGGSAKRRTSGCRPGER